MERTRKCYRRTDGWTDRQMAISIIPHPLRGGGLIVAVSRKGKKKKKQYLNTNECLYGYSEKIKDDVLKPKNIK